MRPSPVVSPSVALSFVFLLPNAQVATRKFCPCGASPWLDNWLGKCCRFLQKRVLAIVATIVFGAVVFFLSRFGLVVFLQVQASIVVSFCLRFWVVARPFFGLRPSGLNFFLFSFLVLFLLSWGLGILCVPSLWMFPVLCHRTPARMLLSSSMVNTMRILGPPLFKFFLGGR